VQAAFGSSVVLSNDLLVIGAAAGNGSVCFYDLSTLSSPRLIAARTLASVSGSRLGAHVAVHRSPAVSLPVRVLVSAPGAHSSVLYLVNAGAESTLTAHDIAQVTQVELRSGSAALAVGPTSVAVTADALLMGGVSSESSSVLSSAYLSLTAYCSPNMRRQSTVFDSRRPAVSLTPLAVCVACPSGQLALGGVDGVCEVCTSELTCVKADQRNFNASLNATILEHGNIYSVAVIAVSQSGARSNASTPDFLLDLSPPETGSVIDLQMTDGRLGNASVADSSNGLDSAADEEFSSNSTALGARWSGFMDPESDIRSYFFCVGTAPLSEDILPCVDVGLVSQYTAVGLSLSTAVRYYVSVYAENYAGLRAGNSSNGVMIDLTPPVMVSCNDGGTVGTDIDEMAVTDTILGNWNATDGESGIREYHWCAGTTPYGCEIRGFYSSYDSHTWQLFNLRLQAGKLYYVTARAVNRAGLMSAPLGSNGVRLGKEEQWVDPTLESTFGVAPHPLSEGASKDPPPGVQPNGVPEGRAAFVALNLPEGSVNGSTLLVGQEANTAAGSGLRRLLTDDPFVSGDNTPAPAPFMRFGNYSFAVEAAGGALDDDGVYRFHKPITVTLNYDPATMIPGAGLSSVELALQRPQLHYWSVPEQEWRSARDTCAEPTESTDLATKTYSVNICHLTQFAVWFRAAPLLPDIAAANVTGQPQSIRLNASDAWVPNNGTLDTFSWRLTSVQLSSPSVWDQQFQLVDESPESNGAQVRIDKLGFGTFVFTESVNSTAGDISERNVTVQTVPSVALPSPRTQLAVADADVIVSVYPDFDASVMFPTCEFQWVWLNSPFGRNALDLAAEGIVLKASKGTSVAIQGLVHAGRYELSVELVDQFTGQIVPLALNDTAVRLQIVAPDYDTRILALQSAEGTAVQVSPLRYVLAIDHIVSASTAFIVVGKPYERVSLQPPADPSLPGVLPARVPLQVYNPTDNSLPPLPAGLKQPQGSATYVLPMPVLALGRNSFFLHVQSQAQTHSTYTLVVDVQSDLSRLQLSARPVSGQLGKGGRDVYAVDKFVFSPSTLAYEVHLPYLLKDVSLTATFATSGQVWMRDDCTDSTSTLVTGQATSPMLLDVGQTCTLTIGSQVDQLNFTIRITRQAPQVSAVALSFLADRTVALTPQWAVASSNAAQTGAFVADVPYAASGVSFTADFTISLQNSLVSAQSSTLVASLLSADGSTVLRSVSVSPRTLSSALPLAVGSNTIRLVSGTDGAWEFVLTRSPPSMQKVLLQLYSPSNDALPVVRTFVAVTGSAPSFPSILRINGSYVFSHLSVEVTTTGNDQMRLVLQSNTSVSLNVSNAAAVRTYVPPGYVDFQLQSWLDGMIQIIVQRDLPDVKQMSFTSASGDHGAVRMVPTGGMRAGETVSPSYDVFLPATWTLVLFTPVFTTNRSVTVVPCGNAATPLTPHSGAALPLSTPLCMAACTMYVHSVRDGSYALRLLHAERDLYDVAAHGQDRLDASLQVPLDTHFNSLQCQTAWTLTLPYQLSSVSLVQLLQTAGSSRWQQANGQVATGKAAEGVFALAAGSSVTYRLVSDVDGTYSFTLTRLSPSVRNVEARSINTATRNFELVQFTPRPFSPNSFAYTLKLGYSYESIQFAPIFTLPTPTADMATSGWMWLKTVELRALNSSLPSALLPVGGLSSYIPLFVGLNLFELVTPADGVFQFAVERAGEDLQRVAWSLGSGSSAKLVPFTPAFQSDVRNYALQVASKEDRINVTLQLLHSPSVNFHCSSCSPMVTLTAYNGTSIALPLTYGNNSFALMGAAEGDFTFHVTRALPSVAQLQIRRLLDRQAFDVLPTVPSFAPTTGARSFQVTVPSSYAAVQLAIQLRDPLAAAVTRVRWQGTLVSLGSSDAASSSGWLLTPLLYPSYGSNRLLVQSDLDGEYFVELQLAVQEANSTRLSNACQPQRCDHQHPTTNDTQPEVGVPESLPSWSVEYVRASVDVAAHWLVQVNASSDARPLSGVLLQLAGPVNSTALLPSPRMQVLTVSTPAGGVASSVSYDAVASPASVAPPNARLASPFLRLDKQCPVDTYSTLITLATMAKNAQGAAVYSSGATSVTLRLLPPPAFPMPLEQLRLSKIAFIAVEQATHAPLSYVCSVQ